MIAFKISIQNMNEINVILFDLVGFDLVIFGLVVFDPVGCAP